MARTLIWLGLTLFLVGLAWSLFPGLFSWFGRLPGDLRVETRSGVVFVPLTSMILVSLALTVVLNLFFRR